MTLDESLLQRAADAILGSHHAIAFTGAGISADSGIPTFRGSADSIWQRYDPSLLELDTFLAHPQKAWPCVREVFYKYMSDSSIVPNKAHRVLADLEKRGILKCIVTQNVDDLHQQAGSRRVLPFHGSVETFTCQRCHKTVDMHSVDLNQNPPLCSCGGLLKPDFVFFGEGIPQQIYSDSFDAAKQADVVIVVGTTGEVMPACMVPQIAHQHGATIIEVNPQASAFTRSITDIYIQAKAGEAFAELEKLL